MSGVVSTLGQGSVTQSKSVALSGQGITSAQYFFENPHGILASFSQGTLTPNYVMSNLELGLAVTSAAGFLVRGTTGPSSEALSGSAATFSAGSVRPTTPLSGSASTSAAGTAAPSGAKALTGSESVSALNNVVSGLLLDDTYITARQQSVTSSRAAALLGSASTSAQGTVVAVTSGKTAALVGTEISIDSDTPFITYGTSVPITGNETILAQNNMGAPLRLPLTGSAATVSKGFFGWGMKITGQAITSGLQSMVYVPSSENTFPMFGFPTITVGQGNMQIQREDETDEGDKFVILSGLGITSSQGTMTARGTNWTPAGQPTSEWTPTNNPSSAWVRKDGPSTSWNREE